MSGQGSEHETRSYISLVRGLYLIAFLGVAVFGLQWYLHSQGKSKLVPSGKILSELKASDRIPVDPGTCEGCNVLLITMDTTRADYLGAYGHKGVATPVIDSLARQGVLFANAFTSSPSTLPGHGSIHTGLYPYNHGARANGTFHLNPDSETIARILQREGYATGAAISAYVLDGRFGLDQGFDHYDDDLTLGITYGSTSFRERPAPYTNEAALNWLDTVSDDRFFLWMHYFDPHAPYLPPEPFRTEYAHDPYGGEIAYLDSQIGQLIAALEERGVAENTLIVLAADHGEGLGEHGEFTHSLLVYDSTLHTPLIFKLPGDRPLGKVVERQVSNVDIVPTILDLLGVKPTASFDGSSLLREPAAHAETIYAETISTLVLHGWSPLFAVRRQDAKYIHAPTAELYDLDKDPRELENRLAERPEMAADLSRELEWHIGQDLFGADALAQMVTVDPETAKKLAALGYVSSVGSTSVDLEGAARLDPKDMVPHWENTQHGMHLLLQEGKYQEGLRQLEAAIEAVPDDVWTTRILAKAYIDSGDLDRAEELLQRVLQRVLQRGQNEPAIYHLLASVSASRGQLQEAEKHVRQALELDPRYAPAYVTLGSLAESSQGWEKALELYQAAIDMDPGTTGPDAYNRIGSTYLKRLELEQARDAFAESLALDPLNGDARRGLAAILIEKGDLAQAERWLSEAAGVLPNNPRVLTALAALHNERGDYDEGIRYARLALAVHDELPQVLDSPGSAPRDKGELAAALLEAHPDAVNPIFRLGRYHLRSGNLELAEERASQAIRAAPSNGGAYSLLGQILIEDGRYSEAIGHFETAIELAPNIAHAHYHLGRALAASGQSDGSYAAYQRAVEVDKSFLPARVALTEAAIERGHLRLALSTAESLVSDYPERVEPLMLQADVHKAANDSQGVLESYQKATEILPSRDLAAAVYQLRNSMGAEKPWTELEQWVAANPDDSQGRSMLAAAYLDAGMKDLATENYGQVMAAAPDAKIAMTLARIENSAGDLDAAAAWLQKGIGIAPTEMAVRAALASLELKRGNSDSALKLLRALRQDYPEAIELDVLEGEVFLSKGNYEGSIDAFDRALEAQPTEYILLKRYQAGKGAGQEDAWQGLDKWFADHPGHINAGLQLAQDYGEREWHDEAVETYRKVLVVDPGNVFALNNLAWAYLKRGKDGDLKRGLAAASKAYEQQPQFAAIGDTYGWMLLQDGQAERAVQILGTVASEDDSEPEIVYHHAVALDAVGKDAEAVALLNRLLADDTTFESREDAEVLRRRLSP